MRGGLSRRGVAVLVRARIRLQTIIWHSVPWVGCMVLTIFLPCLVPASATVLPELVMGPAGR